MTDTTWAEWLRGALAERGWRQATLVANSEGEIKADRVSKWLAGKEKPTHRLAMITANVLDADRGAALIAAGFPELVVDIVPAEQSGVVVELTEGGAEPDPRLSEISDEDLLRELLRRTQARGSNITRIGASRRERVGTPTQDLREVANDSIDERPAETDADFDNA